MLLIAKLKYMQRLCHVTYFFPETWHRLVFIFFLFVASQIFIFAV